MVIVMHKFLIPVSLVIALSYSLAPVKAGEAEWLTEEQMQKMSIAELQEWANKTDKNVKTSRIFKLKSRAHMERRLGYHPMLAENSPDVQLRDELHPNKDTRPDGAKSSAFPEPHYYDETMRGEDKGIVGGVLKVVGFPLTESMHMLHHVGKGMEKVLYFLDERFPWI